jgi:hypothetical protein
MSQAESFRKFVKEFLETPQGKDPISIPELIKLHNEKYPKNKIKIGVGGAISSSAYKALQTKDGPELKKRLNIVSGNTGLDPSLKTEIRGKTVEPAIYERTFTDGSKKYYAAPNRNDKIFRQPIRDSIEEARDDLKKFDIENPKAKTIIEKQAEAVAERGGTLVDNPKLNKAIEDAKLDLKNYHSKIKVIHVPTFINKHLGKDAKLSSITKFKSEIIPEIKKIGMVQTSTLKSFKALRDYQLAPSIEIGTTPKIAEKYNLNKKVFESAIKSADVAVPGFRRKIPLKFGDEAERKRAANKKEVAAQRKFSQATMEKFYSGPKDSGIQKSHMGDKFFTEVTARNLGYAPSVINQEALKEFDEKLRSLKKKQLRLIKNKPNNWKNLLEEANVKGMRLAAESGGYKTFETIDPDTLKRYEYGVDLRKTIDPMDLTEGASLKEIKKSKTLKDLIELNRPMSIELQKQANEMIEGANKISKREQLVLCSLLSRGGLPGDCTAAIKKDPVKFAQEVNKLPYEEGPINKVKSAATKFLQSPILRGAGKYGAIAAGGAVAAGFVKKFMNDDPTTYLSNEEQQKNLLMDMVTGSLDDTPEESPAIGDAYLPALGAATVAGTAAVAPSTIDAARSGALGAKKSGITKTALKTLGRGLAATTTPLGLLATEPLYLADQVQQGDSLGEIATNPFNYFGAAFASDADRIVSRGLSPSIAKTMRLGISPTTLKTVSRRFGLPGLALSLGISGYETYDDFKNKRGFFSNEE